MEKKKKPKGPVLYPHRKMWLLQGDRRYGGDKGYLWVQDDQFLGGMRIKEKRRRGDMREVAAAMKDDVNAGAVVGQISALVRPSGEIDLVVAGVAYDVPGIAAILGGRLKLLIEDWGVHPDDYLDEFDDLR